MGRGYDLFLSFQHLDQGGSRTRDGELAEELCHFLRRRGLTVFFNDFTLESLGASEFRRRIDEGLDDSHVLVAIGTSSVNLESKWVRYEWESFDTDLLS